MLSSMNIIIKVGKLVPELPTDRFLRKMVIDEAVEEVRRAINAYTYGEVARSHYMEYMKGRSTYMSSE